MTKTEASWTRWEANNVRKLPLSQLSGPMSQSPWNLCSFLFLSPGTASHSSSLQTLPSFAF